MKIIWYTCNMNIFILDDNITKSAQYHCDKHVVKMLTETCQILCTVDRKFFPKAIIPLPDFIYKPTHAKHPCVLWCKNSLDNWLYCLNLARALYDEYQHRYNKPDKHQRNLQIINFWGKHVPNLPIKELTPFAQAMPDKYKNKSAVTAYRDYYKGEKQHLFKWTKRHIPRWI